MRVFVAGASGVVGVPLTRMLVAAGHAVAGMTRSQADLVRSLGADPVICDVYDAARLRDVVAAFAPDIVVHELTDLPDDVAALEASLVANRRIRDEGTRNLLAAAGGAKTLAQSIAFPPGAPEHERLVLDAGGVVLRYGIFHGPGTYHPHDLPPEPRVHVDVAARRTVEALDAPPGTILEIVD